MGKNKLFQRVGVKELKDRASELLARIEKDGRSITITKNSREIAKLVAIRARSLSQIDFIASRAVGSWDGIELLPMGEGQDATETLEEMMNERSES